MHEALRFAWPGVGATHPTDLPPADQAPPPAHLPGGEPTPVGVTAHRYGLTRFAPARALEVVPTHSPTRPPATGCASPRWATPSARPDAPGSPPTVARASCDRGPGPRGAWDGTARSAAPRASWARVHAAAAAGAEAMGRRRKCGVRCLIFGTSPSRPRVLLHLQSTGFDRKDQYTV